MAIMKASSLSSRFNRCTPAAITSPDSGCLECSIERGHHATRLEKLEAGFVRPSIGRKKTGLHFRVSVARSQPGKNDSAPGTDSLLDALKAVESSWAGRGQARKWQPRVQENENAGDDAVNQVEAATGTISLLEALRATEQSKPSKRSDEAKPVVALSPPGLQNPSAGAATPSRQSTSRGLIEVGSLVDVVLKKDQVNDRLTRGVVAKILTNSPDHPRGIKVKLKGGEVGRIHEVIAPPSRSTSPTNTADNAALGARSDTGLDQSGDSDGRGEGFSGRTASEAQAPKGGVERKAKEERGTKIFLTGLSRETTNEDLRAALQDVDGVLDAFLVLNKQKQCQGYGFAQLEGDVEAALEKMNELEVRGQKLIAAVSIEKKAKTSESAKAGGGVRGGKEEKGQGGERQRSTKAQPSEVRNEDGARLLLEAFQEFQKKKKAVAASPRKAARSRGGRIQVGEISHEPHDESVPPSDESPIESLEDGGSESGEPRVITISDDVPKEVDPNQPSMGELVMAALERAREKKGIGKGQVAVSSSSGVPQASRSGDVSSDDEQDQVPLRPLRIDPSWTERIEALSRRLEEIKRSPIEM